VKQALGLLRLPFPAVKQSKLIEHARVMRREEKRVPQIGLALCIVACRDLDFA